MKNINQSIFCLIIFNIIYIGLGLAFNYVQGGIFDALQFKNQSQFLYHAGWFILIIILMAGVYSLKNYSQNFLGYNLRKDLTNNFLSLKLNQNIKNYDQRISEDINKYVNLGLDFIIKLIFELINLILYSVLIYNLAGIKILIIGYIYAVVSSLIFLLHNKKLIILDYNQESFEADFRYQLIIEDKNKNKNTNKNYYINTDSLFNNLKLIINQKIMLNFNQNLLQNFNFLLPYLLVAPLFFDGIITLGVLKQISSGFVQICFSGLILVNNFEQFAELVSARRRISELIS